MQKRIWVPQLRRLSHNTTGSDAAEDGTGVEFDQLSERGSYGDTEGDIVKRIGSPTFRMAELGFK